MDITYALSITQPAQHLLDVAIDVADVDAPYLDFVLPTWTPGSYLIREYARHVQEVRAIAGDQSTMWQKIDKQTWRVDTNGSDRVTLHYRVYGNELTVRTNHVDDTHAHVVPAATWMYVAGATHQPLAVTIAAPQGWQIATGLDRENTEHRIREQENEGTQEQRGQFNPSPIPDPRSPIPRFVADDFDHLIDSPFEIGQQRSLPFAVDGVPHRIVIWGRGNEDEQRLVRDVQRIVETTRDLFGGLPYDHYTFFLMLAGKGAGGGLEHRNSTSLLLPRFVFGTERSYERALTLFCHEFFHVWNVKRIRAAGLGPFDYTREAYTTLLWAMEGVTEYYTDLLLLRAGLYTPERYLERLADDVVTIQTTPGRALQSLECSSFDTWIKLYRPDENSINTSISYYLKGAVVAALLDLELRQRTDGERSLDDVLRYLFAAYPLDGPGIPERDGYLAAIRAATGQDMREFFARYIGGVDELPYDEVLGAFGLRTQWDWKDKAPDGAPRVALGVRTKSDGGQLRVSNVLRDGPAYVAGINADDELIALDGWRVTDEGTLRERLNDRKVGDRISLTVARREELRTIEVTLQAGPPDKLALRRIEQPSAQQQRLYDGWIGQG